MDRGGSRLTRDLAFAATGQLSSSLCAHHRAAEPGLLVRMGRRALTCEEKVSEPPPASRSYRIERTDNRDRRLKTTVLARLTAVSREPKTMQAESWIPAVSVDLSLPLDSERVGTANMR